MAEIKGHTGLLSIYDTAAYKPIVCLTSTSYSRALVMTEKVNYCTEGETQSSAQSINRTISFDAEYSTAEAAQASYVDVDEAMESMTEQFFKLEGRGSAIYFKGYISSLDDTFQAGEDATFSGEITVNEKYDTDPKSTP